MSGKVSPPPRMSLTFEEYSYGQGVRNLCTMKMNRMVFKNFYSKDKELCIEEQWYAICTGMIITTKARIFC